jgi:hypothetical protein
MVPDAAKRLKSLERFLAHGENTAQGTVWKISR